MPQPRVGRFDAFLCHASADKASVRSLARRLSASGLTTWLDEEQIKPGDPITTHIEKGLRESRYVIVCLSPSLGQSNWVRAEYGPALHREVRQKDRRVIPVVLQPVTEDDIPVLLYDKQRVDLAKEDEFMTLVQILRSDNQTKANDPGLPASIWAADGSLPTRTRIILEYHNRLVDQWTAAGSRPDLTWLVSGWGSAETQTLRFKALLDTLGYQAGSVLDIGCGTGDLARYMRERGVLSQYEGWDFNPRLIAIAKSFHPDLVFDVLNHSDQRHREFDYVVASGTFQYSDPEDSRYYVDICRSMYARCRIGIAINFLSAMRETSEMSKDELYLYPEDVIRDLRALSGYWKMDHSYHPGFADFTVSLIRPTPLAHPWKRPRSSVR